MSGRAKLDKRHPLILHAEDQPMVAEAVQLILRQSGYEVEPVADGVEALRRLSSYPERYDMLIMDVSMPEMDGWTLIENLAQTDFTGPVIVLSAYPGDEIEGLKRPGVIAVVPKPFKIQHLVRAVTDGLADYNPPDARDSARIE